MTDTLVPFDDVLGVVRPGAGPRGPRRAQHRHQDVLRLPDASSAPSPTPRSARPASACPARCRSSTARRWSRRSGSGSRSTARSPSGAGSRGRTTSTRTCRRTSRPRSTTSRSASRATSTSTCDGETFRVEIERAHMEEDTGKSLHVGGATGRIHGADYSLVDYNRAGIPLIEIVTKPILGAGEKAPDVARAYVAQLRDLIVALGVSDARMDQGSIRADVNLSLAPKGSGVLGTRTETKNVNSLRSVERAVRYEMSRHAAILDAGGADPAGDPALARGHRHHHVGPREVRRRGLPLLPGAGPGAGRPVAGVGRGAARHAAGEPDREAGPAAGRVGLLRPRDARHRRRRSARAGRGDRRRRRDPAGRPEVVALRAGPARQRHRASSSTSSA